MGIEKYIISYCAISENAVWKNGENIYENKDTLLAPFLLSVYNHLNISYPKFYKMDNLSKLGWLASELLLKDEPATEKFLPEEIGIVLSNANSSLDSDLKYFETVYDRPSPSLFVYTLPNIVMGEICIRNNFKGEIAFFINKRFDAEFLEQYVSNLLNNKIKMCICGWVDVLQEEYRAVLFLVTKNTDRQFLRFTKENMNNLFKEPIKLNQR